MRYPVALCAFCCCAVAGGQPAGSHSSLTVLLMGDRVPLPVLKAMEHQAEAAVLPSNFKLNWKLQEDFTGSVVNGRLAIIYMRGQCSANPGAGTVPLVYSSTPLGQTHIADGRILPIADVLCDPIRGLVDHNLRGESPRNRDDLLGRALGRVLAHELYHILLQTTGHGRRGLSREGQTSSELLAPRDGFAPSDERRIAESLSLSPH